MAETKEQTVENLKFDELETPKAEKTRMNWNVSDIPADDVQIDAKKTRKGNPYLRIDHPQSGSVLAVNVSQVLKDQEEGTVKLIVSEEGEPLEIDPTVKVGVNADGVFFFTS